MSPAIGSTGQPWRLPMPWLGGARWRRRHPVRPGARSAGTTADAGFGGGDDEPTEWVTVYWASGLEEAHVVRGRLLQEDIPVLLKSEAAVLGTTGVVGVRVQVPRALEGRARDALASA